MKRLAVSILFFLCAVISSSSAGVRSPRLRPSPYFGSITGMSYADISGLGEHNYERASGEKNPLVYTARAGYIDIGHLRESADRARYLFEVCQENILEGNVEFSYKVIEPAVYSVTLEYPDDWDQLTGDLQQDIAREIAIDLGQHFAQLSTIWHEIITWYGYASTGLLSEKPSSFSWEDSYSDLLGTKLAAMVLRENAQPYNEAMTEIIFRELLKLDPQPAATAKKATRTIDGKWFFGRYPFLTMKKRNFDVGFDDGSITPFRVPQMGFDAPPQLCAVPALESLDRHGFTRCLQMRPKANQKRQILKIIYPNKDGTTLQPDIHFPQIIEHIRAEAIRKSGPDVEKPTL